MNNTIFMHNFLIHIKKHLKIYLYLIMVIFGIYSGFSNIKFLHILGTLCTDLFIKIFQFLSLPIIMLSLMTTISSHSLEGHYKKIWNKTILYTLTTTIIAASVANIVYNIINPRLTILKNSDFILPKTIENIDYLKHVTNIVPNNILEPFLHHQVISILLMALLFGFCIRLIPNIKHKETVIAFIQGLYSVFIIIAQGVVAILPIGLFGFVTTTLIQFRQGVDIAGIGEYLAVIISSNLIQGLIVLPAWLAWNRLSPFTTIKKMMPALTVAFFSKSSSGTLPITINAAENNLKINPKVARIVLPLCTTINMNGCAAFIFSTVIYVMQSNGYIVSYIDMGLWVIVSTIAAVGNAGVPMGCFFLSASLLSGMDIPITLLGLILPFYSIIDMVETSLNVWSDSCITYVIDHEIAKIVG